MKLPHTFLIACLGAAPLCAQQVEPKTEAPKPVPAEGAAANGEGKTEGRNPNAQPGHHHSRGNAQPQPEQKPVAYIGVLTREVPPELRAQSFPDRPVRMLIPFAAGSATDVYARLVGKHLSDVFGQQFGHAAPVRQTGQFIVGGGQAQVGQCLLELDFLAAHARA